MLVAWDMCQKEGYHVQKPDSCWENNMCVKVTWCIESLTPCFKSCLHQYFLPYPSPGGVVIIGHCDIPRNNEQGLTLTLHEHCHTSHLVVECGRVNVVADVMESDAGFSCQSWVTGHQAHVSMDIRDTLLLFVFYVWTLSRSWGL